MLAEAPASSLPDHGEPAASSALALGMAGESGRAPETGARPDSPAATPLQGRCVVVTRARAAGGSFAAGLRALGAEVIEFPTIEIVAPDSYAAIDAALARLASFDWMLFTSASGVERMFERMRTLGVDRSALDARRSARLARPRPRAWPRMD